MIRPENRNILWATILVDELARAGVRHAVICPGSRSTPLAVAFSRDDRFTIHTIIDERAAAFFAMGIGKASGNPAVVVCTSGTAAANFFPAIIEASMSNVPMIVMTADRPHELRDSGANQTIDQVKLYGNYVRWFVDVAPPHANPEDKTLRYLRTTIDRAFAYSEGANGGPVHLNVPFEKPLEPVFIQGDVPDQVWEGIGAQGRASEITYGHNRRFTAVITSLPKVRDQYLEDLIVWILRFRKGLIICGTTLYYPFNIYSVAKLAAFCGYPVLAEGISHLRYASQVEDIPILGGYESFLRADFAKAVAPEIIIQVGELPVGAALLNFLSENKSAKRVLISSTGKWTDELHLTTLALEDDLSEIMPQAEEYLKATRSKIVPNVEWLETFRNAEAETWNCFDQLRETEEIEGGILADVFNHLPELSKVFVANSNPVRHLDQFVQPLNKNIRVYANRGVSGIDGTVASALGIETGWFESGLNGPLVLVIGDTALYHDLNSLHLIRRLNIPLIIVCINNDGGGIFHRLPIANYDPPFRDLLVMPHGLTFEHAAAMFDIPYTLAQMGDDFRSAFKNALASGAPALIEVPSDAAKFEAQRKQLIETVAQRIKDAGILERLSKNGQPKH
jgi:2-succinyl-5-enolpyruvyl-6-hydroxy-3-cyclohexene-1-carboxylate synthase